MLKKLIPCYGKYKKYAILTPITVIFEVLFDVLIPLVMASIINVGIKGDGGMPHILKMGGLMALLAVLAMGCGALSGRCAALASAGLSTGLRSQLFAKIQRFSFSNVDRFSDASLVTRLTADVTNVQQASITITRMLVRAPAMLVLASVMAVRINKSLTAVFLVAVPVLAVALFLLLTRAFPRFQAMLKGYDKMNARVQENLIAIRVVKAYVRGEYETVRFNEAAEALRNAQYRAERLLICNMPIMQTVTHVCMIAVSWFGGKYIIGGTMLSGDLLGFISYINQILMSLMMLSMSFVTLVLSKASAARICEVLDEEPDISDEAADPGLTVADGSVDFENVSFSYANDANNLTLEGIDLHIRSGEIVGIIGGTGSAKSSLVQLIPRLYDVHGGQLLVGGRDVRDYKLQALRDSVAMVLQKNVLFTGTIRENLLWGKEDATEEELRAACQAAQADDFIRSFPDGYDTYLGQGGVNVSGGQKQRLCIARALLRSPKILILDDSTSAVDTATDAKIRGALGQFGDGGVTTIIIAQRIASVMEADKIVVMDDGRISACGTHEELLQTSAIYREVFDSQQKGVA